MKACPRSAIVAGLLLLPLHGALAQPPAAGKKPAAPPVNAPAPLMTLTGHTNGVFHVAYSPDGKLLATSSKDHTVKLWDAASGKEVRALKGHTNDVYSTAFRPDGKVLASASEDKTIRLWEVATAKELQVLRGHSGDVYGLAFSPDGKVLASGSMDHDVRLWDAATGKELRVLRGHGSRVCTVAFSPDGKRLVSACGTPSSGSGEAGGEIKVWDVSAGKEVFALPTASQGVITVVFSPDGKRLAGSCLDRTVRVWELATGREVLALRGHTLHVYTVAFSPDGRRLASCSGMWSQDRGGEVKVWGLPAGRELLSFQAHRTPTWGLAFSRDGARLATVSGKFQKNEPGEVKVWSLAALPPPEGPAPPADRKGLEALWADLGGADAARAYRAVWALSAAPRLTVPFLRENARPPAGGVDYERIARLVAELDDNVYEVRVKATAALEKLGPAAYPALRKALTSPSAEVRRRARMLLEKKGDAPALSPEELRALRVIEVLQHIGTAEVRPVLEKLAAGPKDAVVTQDAAAALALLPRRASP
jgi:DNA-binding beta-propeller fold protein YncE